MTSTLRDVARAANVSFSTAALAFRRPHRVAERTRTRILRAAAQLGYKKNQFASILSRSRRTRVKMKPTLGFLTWQKPWGEHQYWLEVKHWSERLNYTLVRLDLEQEKNPQRALNAFYAQGGSGVFIGPMRGARQLDLSRFVTVQLDRGPFQYGAVAVQHAIFEETMQAFQRIRERGYRAILPAIFSHELSLVDDKMRRGAILACQHELRSGERAIPPLECRHGDTGGLLAAVKKFQPDAVLGFSRWDAMHLREAGFKIPQQLGFASLHLWPDDQHYAGVVQDQFESVHMAYKLMEIMLSLGPQSWTMDQAVTTVVGRWIDGPTLR